MNLGFSNIIRYKRFVLNIQNKWIEMGFYCTNDVIIFNYEVMREVASRRFIRPSVVLCYRIIEFVCVSMLTNSNVRNKNACENRTFLSNTDQILRYFFSSSEQQISLILFFVFFHEWWKAFDKRINFCKMYDWKYVFYFFWQVEWAL